LLGDTKLAMDLFGGEKTDGTKASAEDISELLINEALTAVLFLD